MTWNVYCYDFNSNKIMTYNIFCHGSFREDVTNDLKECNNRDEFAKDLNLIYTIIFGQNANGRCSLRDGLVMKMVSLKLMSMTK